MKTYNEYYAQVEDGISHVWSDFGPIPASLRSAMQYSLTAGGKRLRAVLLLAACDALGGDTEKALPFATALEMIHTYSLIHDDLPAMDNDDLRRGKPTNHKVYGEALAILAGDGLLHAAFEKMARAALAFPDQRGLKALERIAFRSGICGMVAGQTMDVTEEGHLPDPDKISYIHAHKTADLLTAPMEAGLLLANADQKTMRAGVDYGIHFGLAFQMVDDLLDVVGEEASLGKKTGMDAAMGKMTWIALNGVDATRTAAEEQIAQAVLAAGQLGDGEEFFKTLALSSLNRVK